MTKVPKIEKRHTEKNERRGKDTRIETVTVLDRVVDLPNCVKVRKKLSHPSSDHTE